MLISRYFGNKKRKNLKILLNHKDIKINLQNKKGWTALMLACRYGKIEVVKALLYKGADINITNVDGWTAFIIAARYSNLDPSEKILNLLLNQKNLELNKQDIAGWTALSLSIRYMFFESSPKAFELLVIQKNIDINLQAKGWTPLMLATKTSENCVQKLLEKEELLINLKNNDGWTALMLASRYSKLDSSEKIVEMLLKHKKIDVNLQKKDGKTALILASTFSNKDSSDKTVELLLEHKDIDINILDNKKFTALMCAAAKGNFSTVEILLKHQDNFDQCPHILFDLLKSYQLNKRVNFKNSIIKILNHDKINYNFGNKSIENHFIDVDINNLIKTNKNLPKNNFLIDNLFDIQLSFYHFFRD
jgi:ankyrin repeat protein